MRTKILNSNFFKKWTPEMSYVLGYIVADGSIIVDKTRPRNPYSLNITSAEKAHLCRIRKAIGSTHKVNKKPGGNSGGIAYQLQLRNSVITGDLIKFGILPRKTHTLGVLQIREKYFSDFVRGFFDGDGSVYIYNVNGTPQIKASFVCSRLLFLADINKRLCGHLGVALKDIHKEKGANRKMILYSICFYVDDCEKLFRFMYKGNSSLHLPRKYKIFKRWKDYKRRSYVKQNYPSKVGWRLNQ